RRGRGGRGGGPAGPGGGRGGAAPPAGGPPAGGGVFGGIGTPIPPQDVAEVSNTWPSRNVDARMATYLCQAQQKWTIAAAPNAGGYPGSPFFKITIEGTGRVLGATADDELVVLPAFTGASEQLWRIEQLPDGAWRILSK